MAKDSREVYKCIMFMLVFTLSSGINPYLDVGFIIDGSGSVNNKDPNNWNLLLHFLVDLVERFPKQGTKVGVVVFSDKGRLEMNLDTHAHLSSVIQTIPYLNYPGSTTNLSGGLYITRTELFNIHNGDRPNVSNLAILITDVDDPARVDRVNIIPNAKKLHRDGIRVICIGIGNEANALELRDISSPPHEMDLDYFIVKDFYYLDDLTSRLINTMYPTSFEKTTQGFPRTTLQDSTAPIEDNKFSVQLLASIIPIICCLIIITIIFLIICIRRCTSGKRDDAVNETASNSKDACVYDNETFKKGEPSSDSKSSKHPTTPMYEQAAPAILYDDATSVATITRPKPQPGLSSYETVGVHPQYPDTYDQVHHPSSDTYDQVDSHPTDSCTYDNVDGAEGPDKEKGIGDQKRASNLYASVQRRASLIYAQVQKKKSYIYAQVNKRRK